MTTATFWKRLRTGILSVALLLVSCLAWAAEPAATAPAARTDLNVLFIGNSMTWFCNMPRTVAELAEKMDPPVRVHAAMAVGAMNTLAKVHSLEGSNARKAIAGNIEGSQKAIAAEIAWATTAIASEPGNALLKADLARLQSDAKALEGKPVWDVVVIQPWAREDVKDPVAFAANVKILRDDITKSSPNARVIMYMDATGYMDAFDSAEKVRSIKLPAYRELMLGNKVEVAPAALTGQLICKERPDYWLKPTKLPKDAHHGMRGAYAIACTIFATIFDRSPEGRSVHRMEAHYEINGKRKGPDNKHKVVVEGKHYMEYFDDKPTDTLSDADMALIQGKAWQACREWKEFCRKSQAADKPAEKRAP